MTPVPDAAHREWLEDEQTRVIFGRVTAERARIVKDILGLAASGTLEQIRTAAGRLTAIDRALRIMAGRKEESNGDDEA